MTTPIPMVLHCPSCGMQHIDEPSKGWDNPPHTSHKCQNPACQCVWRPADVRTAGVLRIDTRGRSDSWEPGKPTLRDLVVRAEPLVAEAQEALVERDDVCVTPDGEDALRLLRDEMKIVLGGDY